MTPCCPVQATPCWNYLPLTFVAPLAGVGSWSDYHETYVSALCAKHSAAHTHAPMHDTCDVAFRIQLFHLRCRTSSHVALWCLDRGVRLPSCLDVSQRLSVGAVVVLRRRLGQGMSPEDVPRRFG